MLAIILVSDSIYGVEFLVTNRQRERSAIALEFHVPPTPPTLSSAALRCMLTRRPFIRFLSCGIRRMSSARGHDINPKKPPPGVHQVEKLISSTVEGVGSLMNETLLVGKILSQAAGREAQAAVHDAGDSMQKRLEDYLSSPEALEQLGDKRVELIREQVKASRELFGRGGNFSESNIGEQNVIERLATTSARVALKFAVSVQIEHRIISTLSPKASAGGGSSAAFSQSDPRKLIQFIRHVSQQRQERLSEYVDALLASGQLTKHPLVPHEFEKKLYLDILSIVTFAFENAMGSLDNIQLWGHAVKVRSVQESEPFINFKISGTSIHGREQLGIIVDSMLRDEFVNNPLIPDAVERSLYLNTVILIFRILEDLSNSLHVSVMGHRLEWRLIPLDIAEVHCQKAPSHIKLNEEVIDRLVKELLSDASINVFWIPDIIESAIYRNVLRLMLRVVEELLGRVELDLLGTAFSLKLVNMRDSSLWSFQAELEGDYYKSLAQVPTKELQERLYELQNEHEMIGKVQPGRSS
ncbi:kelch-like [Perkinsus olseni]|uniref:Kelch-like n=1 Tax=Perkinsus olseni TaxID=32597 RepID=A0A7J6NV24_PEROL|nr:kelch-like [Perkinsus olseni]